MKTKKLNIILLVLLLICTAVGCHSRQKPDIRPHPVNLSADSFYQQAVAILQSSYDVDSTRYKRQNKMFRFYKTFCSEFSIVNTKQNVHFATKKIEATYSVAFKL